MAGLGSKVARNRANGISCHRYAVSDADGTVLLDNDPVKRGTSRILNEIRPSAIYFEVCPALTVRAGFAAEEPARMLLDAGYELRPLTDTGALTPATLDEIAGASLENWLATPR